MSIFYELSESIDGPDSPSSGIRLYCTSNELYAINNTGNPSLVSASSTAPYILTQPADNFDNSVALSSLDTGILKNTTSTGMPSIATAGTDYYGPNAPLYLYKASFGNGIMISGIVNSGGGGAGDKNIFIGNNCGFLNDSSTNLTAVGMDAFQNTVSANYSVAIGTAAGRDIESGDSNVFIGQGAGTPVTDCDLCTFIGFQTTSSSVTGLNNSTALGGGTNVNISNAINLGSGCNVGINNPEPVYALDILPVLGSCAISLVTSSLPATPESGRVAIFYDGTNFKFVDSTGTVHVFTTIP